MRALELKRALIFALLIMILLRLVWMDLRSYVISYAPQNRYAFDQSELSGDCRRSLSLRQIALDHPSASTWQRPGWPDASLYQKLLLKSCSNGVFQEGRFVRYNQGLLIACLFICVLISRILARSWVVGLIVAVSLLSRGRLLSANGLISGNELMAVGLAFWTVLMAHWFRSGSWLIYLSSFAVLAVLMGLDPGFAGMGFAPILLILAWRPLLLRKAKRYQMVESLSQGPEQQSGRDLKLWQRWGTLLNLSMGPVPDLTSSSGLFQPLADGIRPFVNRLRFKRTFRLATSLGLGLLGLTFIIQVFLKKYGSRAVEAQTWQNLELWFRLFLEPLDRDLILSITMMVLALTWRSRWLPYLRPLINLVGIAMVLHLLGSGWLDLFYLPEAAQQLWQGPQILLVWEPVMLTLSILAFYQMSLSLLARWDRVPWLGRWLNSLK